MKTIITIIIFGLSLLASYGQELKLSVIENSDEPNTASEHFYLVNVTNTSSKSAPFSLATTNTPCSKGKSIQTDFSHQVLDNKKARQPNGLNINSGQSVKVYIKLMRSKTARLNSWNCTEVTAISSEGRPISNTITIESFIPDPKDFN
ncbi:hypothetical protein [Winogradskyella bathintestinalis]|uniref:DUF11 domain-containing protein n=1 Tax=Winogradskyella bathintestinalis TaxID=3035208 RepID=A0ABT7ZTC7_9FLAO|nr:hypothetical protein [Winogradskyella bathintestinalis]MDN3492084.1 hypothetical protein [Winogradskyella bathintestinalis]